MLNNIVDNLEQCGQQNIVHGCFHQARTGCSFFAVYAFSALTSQLSTMLFKELLPLTVGSFRLNNLVIVISMVWKIICDKTLSVCFY